MNKEKHSNGIQTLFNIFKNHSEVAPNGLSIKKLSVKRSSLTHQSIHSGEKSYKCAQEESAFRQMRVINRQQQQQQQNNG